MKKYQPGKLFVFEGPDDVGKTTLAEMLGEHLSSLGHSTTVLSFPGREPETVSELIYRLYHNPVSLGVKTISPFTMQVLVTAAHIEVIETRLKPLIEAGTNVVLDRFWWSTWVYATLEGVSEGARDQMIELEMTSWGKIHPELVFFVFRREPLLLQRPEKQWPRILSLYQELVELQKTAFNIQLVPNDNSKSQAFDTVVASLNINRC